MSDLPTIDCPGCLAEHMDAGHRPAGDIGCSITYQRPETLAEAQARADALAGKCAEMAIALLVALGHSNDAEPPAYEQLINEVLQLRVEATQARLQKAIEVKEKVNPMEAFRSRLPAFRQRPKCEKHGPPWQAGTTKYGNIYTCGLCGERFEETSAT